MSAAAVAAVVTQMQGTFAPLDSESASQAAWEGQCALTKKQRFIGFAGCVGFGLVISFMSFLFLTRPTVFAMLYTIGNLVAVASTGFLVGEFGVLHTTTGIRSERSTPTRCAFHNHRVFKASKVGIQAKTRWCNCYFFC